MESETLELLRRAMDLLAIAEERHLAVSTPWRFHAQRLKSDIMEKMKRESRPKSR